MTKPPGKPGRPQGRGLPGASSFGDDVWEEILTRHAQGETITGICRSKPERFPASSTVSWKAGTDAAFAKRYAHARLLYADAVFEETQDIADQATEPVMVPAFTKTGERLVDADGKPMFKADINATKARAIGARLRVDTRFKIIARVNPAKYAERWNVQHSGAIDMGGVDDATLNQRIERKLYEIGAVELLKGAGVAAAVLDAFLALFRVTELPTAPAPVRLLPGEKEVDL